MLGVLDDRCYLEVLFMEGGIVPVMHQVQYTSLQPLEFLCSEIAT